MNMGGDGSQSIRNLNSVFKGSSCVHVQYEVCSPLRQGLEDMANPHHQILDTNPK